MNDARITVTGNLAAPVSLRTLPDGTSVASFRVAHTPRKRDRATGAWSDGQTLWFTVSCWRTLAEHCAKSMSTGDRVVVTGALRATAWTSTEGVERSGLEVEATAVGLDLARATAKAVRAAPLVVTRDPGPGLHGEGVHDAGEEELDGLEDDEDVPVPALAG